MEKSPKETEAWSVAWKDLIILLSEFLKGVTKSLEKAQRSKDGTQEFSRMLRHQSWAQATERFRTKISEEEIQRQPYHRETSKN